MNFILIGSVTLEQCGKKRLFCLFFFSQKGDYRQKIFFFFEKKLPETLPGPTRMLRENLSSIGSVL